MSTSYVEVVNRMSPVRFQKLKKVADDHLDTVYTALSLTIIYRSEWVFEAAWGWVDPETQTHPVTPSTLFDLASVTKLFTTTAFLSLVSEGAIALDDALVETIPEFGASGPRPMDGGQDPHTREMLPIPPEVRGKTADPTRVTYRQLLTHTSGLAPWRAVFHETGSVPPPDRQDPVPREERWAKALHALCRYPFVGDPGAQVRYSDLGMMLLGEAVSRLHGGPLDVVIFERVTSPLGLKNILYNPMRNGYSRFDIVPTEEDLAWRGRRCWGEVHDENACGVGGVAGHAGLFGTAHDLSLFGLAWLEQDPRLAIAPALMMAATQEQVTSASEQRGLGWMLSPPLNSPVGDAFSASTYGHTGFTGTSLWVDPEHQLVVACLTNRVYLGRHKPGIEPFRQRLHSVIAEGIQAGL